LIYCCFTDFIVLFWEIKDIRICCILQKQSSNFDITVKNISANTIKLNDNNQFCSKIITLKSNKLGDIIHPILHSIHEFIYEILLCNKYKDSINFQ
jgi:hypothetical protein